MELSSTNIATAVQLHTTSLLNGALSSLSTEFYPENSRDIDFLVKDALSKQGIACIVATPELEYQGHNGMFCSYDIEVELQIAENPMINRARMRKQDLSWGTGLDVATAAAEALAGPYNQSFMQYVPTTIQQENEGAIVVTRAVMQTHGFPMPGQPLKKWTCGFAPDEWQDAVGDYVLRDCTTGTWDGPNGCVFTMAEEDGKYIFGLEMPGSESLHYEVTSGLRPNDIQFESYDSTPYYINFTAQLKTPHYKWAGDGIELNWAMDNIEDYQGEGSIKVERYLNFTDPIHQQSLFCYHLSNGQLRYELTVWYQDEYGSWSSDTDIIDVADGSDTLAFNNLTTPVTLAKVGPNS